MFTDRRKGFWIEEATLAEVAERVGFADAAYFSRVFAREKKMSPLAWRRKA